MKLGKKPILSILLVCVLALTSCMNKNNNTKESASENTKKEVYISAAASLTDVINEVKGNYEKTHDNITIMTNYAGSGALQSQIEEGAPADIFMSAADKQMDALEEKELIDKDSRVELLKNELVLIKPINSKLEINKFEDILKDDITQIAIADTESVPVGQYSKEIFTNLDMWDKLKSKVVTSQDVRQSLDWVVSENVQCATVYQTDAFVEKDKVAIVALAPENSHKEINYPMAIIKNSMEKEEVKEFYEYLKSDEVKGIYEKYGFVVNK